MLTSFISLLMIVVPVASPSASAPPSQAPLRTIITVVSSPYCNSLADHFNNALVPMLANDRTLDGVSVQLDDLNTLFNYPDYVERFVHVRDTLGRQETVLNDSMAQIQREINALRDGSRLTTDAQAASQVHLVAQELQTAYDKQRQLSIDLQGVHQAMIQYNIMHAHPAMGGFDPAEMSMPADMLNIKSYLHFDRQRATIGTSEDSAADIAYAAVQSNCTATK